MRRFFRTENAALAAGAVLAALVMMFACLSAGCAAGALDAARQSLANSAKVLDGAAQSFEAADLPLQEAIIMSREKDLPGAIADYRKKRGVVLKIMTDAGAVLALAIDTVPLVEVGLKKRTDLNELIGAAWKELLKLQQALQVIGVIPGGAQ